VDEYSMESTTYTDGAASPVLYQGDEVAGKSVGPGISQVTGPQPVQGETPGLVVSRKPTRAERSKANKLMRKQIEVAELALSTVPAGFRVQPEGTGKSVGPGVPQVTGLLTAQDRTHLRKQEQQEKQETDLKPEMGRPDEYTVEETDILCAWVQGGGSMRQYSANTGRAASTLYRWMREHPDFQSRYSQAHEDRADTLTDEMLDIADDAAKEASIEGVAAAKLRVETRKWIASKLRPQKWGDKQVVEHVGAVNIRIGIPSKQNGLQLVEQVDQATVLLTR
jgi:transposase-like protein